MLISVIIVCICICFFIFKLQPRRPKNFPPGPLALPVVGNVLQLSLSDPLKGFDKLRSHYGDVYSIFIGSRPTVILNGFKAIKEAIVTKGSDFAGRPQKIYINDVINGKGVMFVDYGANWKEHRRFAVITLRNFGMGKTSMEDIIHGEIQYILKTLENSIGTTISPQVMFHNAASNIICQVLFNTRYEYDDDFIKVVVRCLTENTKHANGAWAMLYDSIPMIRNLPLPFKDAFTNYKVNTMWTFINNLVTEHLKNRVPGEPRDFVDCYMDELEKKGGDSTFSHEQLIHFTIDLHNAGTDTASNTLLTGFLYLMCYPDVQERCQQEIDQALEGKSQASFEDRHNMPYVQAMIHEVQRIANIVPLSVFHNTTKDTEVMGFTIPNGTMIIENLTSVLNEEGKWKFPHDFNPENFLNEQGEFVKQEAFMPFSAGPRMCPGEALARMELFLIMVTLLRKYKFIWPEDAGKPDLTLVYGITMTTQPYRMRECKHTKKQY
uniref:Cytochrome P450 2F2-like n=1 Tax=Gouania willdenowi TaxID=441366 RepID=A0A8C5H432_GOUWI